VTDLNNSAACVAMIEKLVAFPTVSRESNMALIDFVREDESILKRMHVDVERLCAAYLVEEGK